MSTIQITIKTNADGPFMPRDGSAVTIFRIARLYVAICYAFCGSLIASTLPQWSEPASWPVLLISTIGAPLLPWVVAVEAFFYIDFFVNNIGFAVLTGGFFIISAFLMRKKDIGWWIVILTLIPCTIIASFALHAVGWVPQQTGPLQTTRWSCQVASRFNREHAIDVCALHSGICRLR